MTPSAVRVAYNCFMFISMIVAFIFNICAILGDNWIEGEREGELIHDGLWVTCKNLKCLKFSDTKVVLSEKFKAVQAVMIIACLTCGLSCAIFFAVAVARPKKIVFRILAFTFFLTAVFNVIAMVGYTDIQKDKPKQICFGWSYYTGWVAMATSLLIGLSSIMNEILPQIENSEYHTALTEL